MASFFKVGEEKIRPGVYYRYENNETMPITGADDGKCACVLRSNWGPLDSAVVLNSSADVSDYFGDGGDSGTLDVALEQFKGGAKSVHAVRLGTGGSKSSCVLLDEEGTEVIGVSSKYVGSRELTVTLRPTMEATFVSTSYMSYDDLAEFSFDELADTTYEELEELSYDDDATYEFLVSEGTTLLERITFTNAQGEKTAWNLVEMGAYSSYVDFTMLAVTDSSLETVVQENLQGGTDPYVDVSAYSNAFGVLETYRWNVLALDTEDNSIQLLSQLFLQRIYEDGKFVMGVVGESTSVNFETRLEHAKNYNDYQMIYVGSGFVDSLGQKYQGYLAAARVSGMIAGTPSNQSITRSVLAYATDLMEYLSTTQYESAISSGMLTFSLSASGVVWVEQGVNTLTVLSENMDSGWKKIKRTKVRFELMQRLNDVTEPLIGKVNNDEDGRMTVVQVCNAICNAMVAEKKLLSGAKVEVDPDVVSQGDSASFVVYADDIDSMEKMYVCFKFRFSTEV